VSIGKFSWRYLGYLHGKFYRLHARTGPRRRRCQNRKSSASNLSASCCMRRFSASFSPLPPRLKARYRFFNRIFPLDDCFHSPVPFLVVSTGFRRPLPPVRVGANHLEWADAVKLFVFFLAVPLTFLGQVRGLLDIFTWRPASFEFCALRPTWASYS
jgi:hypothetical protein